ncbi:REP-associated tyrosine transposase [Pseudoxanthomonas sacheonensis]|uniref:REP-associated tyrosine transposase n=1 Tax=Pseudoxanthomonas sacheonensis TaxID=443615 RepID=UPI0013D199D4|nr:transposase [Pseudoxanthomonas sacheonensis]KAF1712717.1 transposase [Pseudoxanthomonas sacheonensis]
MPDYRRVWVPGGTYFFTVAIAERRRTLLTDRIDELRDAFRVAHKVRPFRIDAIVVLPDHMHCLWTLPPGDDAFSIRWSHIKAGFSRRIAVGEHRRPSRIAKRERGIWQRRYWEHLIRDGTDLRRRVDYIHFNPVKHGYVKQASEWPYSSLHAYIARGDLPGNRSADM